MKIVSALSGHDSGVSSASQRGVAHAGEALSANEALWALPPRVKVPGRP